MRKSLARRRTVILASLGVVLLGGTAVARASAEHPHLVHVVGSLHAVQDTVPDMSLCAKEGGAYAVGTGEVPESGASTLRGTFEGTGKYCGHSLPAVVGPNGSIPIVETDLFTGTVHGCGTGTVTYHVTGFVGAPTASTPGGLPTQEDWRIVAGSGTGGLKGLRGGAGHNSGQVNADGDNTQFNGTVSCIPSAGPRP
ncbi:MAG: hypothetical protein NVS3B26_17270 [Mycobacteriales bacterium]